MTIGLSDSIFPMAARWNVIEGTVRDTGVFQTVSNCQLGCKPFSMRVADKGAIGAIELALTRAHCQSSNATLRRHGWQRFRTDCCSQTSQWYWAGNDWCHIIIIRSTVCKRSARPWIRTARPEIIKCDRSLLLMLQPPHLNARAPNRDGQGFGFLSGFERGNVLFF